MMFLRNNCRHFISKYSTLFHQLVIDGSYDAKCAPMFLLSGTRCSIAVDLAICRSNSSSASSSTTSTNSIGKITTSTRHKATFAPPPLFDQNVKSPSVALRTPPQPFRMPPNMSFNYCNLAPSIPETGPIYELYRPMASSQSQVVTLASRPLVILFAWMLAKDQHIEKYKHFWFQRGFDVLAVKTSPMDLLLPKLGGTRNAINVYQFLSQIRPRYDEVLIHAFSVGGFQFCEVWKYMSDLNEPQCETVFDSFRGLITDSFVYPTDCAPGLSRAITHHPVVQPLIERSIANFLKITKPLTMDQYLKVFSYLVENDRNYPCLFLYSKDDLVSNYRTSDKLIKMWQSKGIMSRSKCWDTSVHVLHYREHPDEYEQEVDNFVSKLKIRKNNNEKSQ